VGHGFGLAAGLLPGATRPHYTRFMRSTTLFILLCRCLTAQEAAGIEGTAIDAITRQPMPGVHITLRSAADAAYGAISGQNGHFSITNMPPAIYFLTAQHNGYVDAPAEAAVTLKPGEPPTEFTVEMTPRALIAGRVVDEFGDPVQHIDVQAVSAVSSSRMGSIAMTGRTDERGQFRMTGAPGKFYVKANVFEQRMINIPEITPDGLGPPVYGTTYYPGSESKDRASAVEVAAGHDLNGIDIHLARKRSLTIGGTVTGIEDRSTTPTTPTPPAAVLLFSRGEGGELHVVREFVVNAEGKFTIPGLPSGSYRLLATYESASTVLNSRCVDVQLDGAGESSVSLALLRGEALSGTLEIEGDDPRKSGLAEKPTVRLVTSSRTDVCYPGEPKGEVDKDGAFRMEQVFPGRFRVRVLPLPENGFVKSVKLDNVETNDDVVDLSRGVGGAGIKVTVSRNGGQVEGAVLGEDGEPLHIPFAFVILAAKAEEINAEGLKLVEAEAKFKFSGIRPGKYRLIAFHPPQFDGDFDAIKAMFPKAPEIEIREGDRIAKDVKIVAAENASAKP
jgi:hypothetical protein